MTMLMPMRAGAIAALGFCGATACTSKVSQCDDVAAAVERHGKTLSRAEARMAGANADASTDAAALADAAAALGAMDLPDAHVGGFAREYAALLHETAGAVEAVGAAAKAREPEALALAIRAFDTLAAREAELVAGLNAYCQAGG
jgi:hypothetical protein